MDRWKALTAKDIWNGQMEGPHSKGASEMDRWKALTAKDHGVHPPDLKQTGSLPILQMVWDKLAAYPYFRCLIQTGSLPILQKIRIFHVSQSGIWIKGGLCPKTLNWMWGLAGSAYKTERDHLNIERLQLCCCIMPNHYLLVWKYDMWTTINLRTHCVGQHLNKKKK